MDHKLRGTVLSHYYFDNTTVCTNNSKQNNKFII